MTKEGVTRKPDGSGRDTYIYSFHGGRLHQAEAKPFAVPQSDDVRYFLSNAGSNPAASVSGRPYSPGRRRSPSPVNHRQEAHFAVLGGSTREFFSEARPSSPTRSSPLPFPKGYSGHIPGEREVFGKNYTKTQEQVMEFPAPASSSSASAQHRPASPSKLR